MAVLRESPWYREILEEGREQARRDDLRRVLAYRFGELPADAETALQRLDLRQLERLFELSLEVATVDEFRAQLPPASAELDGDRAVADGG